MIKRIAITLAASLMLLLGTMPRAEAASYTVNHYWAQESWAWIATYTDSGKNCLTGRKVLYKGDIRSGVTCIRSNWHMVVTRHGASDGIWAPGQEVRIPSGGALVETFVG